MAEWFQSLSVLEKIFAYIAIPSTLILLIQTAMLLFGLGGGGHGDAADGHGDAADGHGDVTAGHAGTGDFHGGDFHDGNIHDGDIHDGTVHDGVHTDDPQGNGAVADGGLRIFTVRGFVAFFTMLGWGGLTFLQSGMHAAVAVLLALALGALSMLLIALILKMMLRLQSDGTMHVDNAIGKSGTVYITVPPKREQRGKVNVIVQEQLVELDAVTDSPDPIKTGAEVTVVALSGKNTVVVAPK